MNAYLNPLRRLRPHEIKSFLKFASSFTQEFFVGCFSQSQILLTSCRTTCFSNCPRCFSFSLFNLQGSLLHYAALRSVRNLIGLFPPFRRDFFILARRASFVKHFFRDFPSFFALDSVFPNGSAILSPVPRFVNTFFRIF